MFDWIGICSVTVGTNAVACYPRFEFENSSWGNFLAIQNIGTELMISNTILILIQSYLFSLCNLQLT